MREMHYFKKSQETEIPSPDFKERVTLKLFLEFLCHLGEWTRGDPSIFYGIEKGRNSLYVIYRDIVFSDYDFCQIFGSYLVVLHQRWQVDVFGTELSAQETAELSLEKNSTKFSAVQRTVSGEYAENIQSLCLRIQCSDAEEMENLYRIFRVMDWKSKILTADWSIKKLLEREDIPWLRKKSCYCYGFLSDSPGQEMCLETLDFSKKTDLWFGFLEEGFDYEEFKWLFDEISHRTLRNRIEWEMALYAALNKLEYTLKISQSEFELFDGKGKRHYFSFDSEQNAHKAILKFLFPLTYR